MMSVEKKEENVRDDETCWEYTRLHDGINLQEISLRIRTAMADGTVNNAFARPFAKRKTKKGIVLLGVLLLVAATAVLIDKR